jgi:signal transduction histidine kinase
MDITEMNGGCAPCAIQLQNQTISFPTMDGLLWVNSDNARPLLPEGNVFVDQFMAGSRSISPDSLSLVSISPNAQDILIRIGFSAWCNKENVYLDYQLNGRNEWIPVDVNNGAIIKLSNLQPGNYRLMIRKMNGFGVGNYSYKEIRFTISTPWYQQWWFYLLSILFITGAISLYFNYRTRQYSIRQRKLEEQVAEKTKELQEQNELLEKNNSIKTRLISIISHDIVTPLKFLNVAGKNLIEKRKLMSEDLQVETLKEITNTSQELQLLSTNILNWIKYQNENRRLVKENFNLHEMVAQLLGLLQSLARQKKLIILNNVAPELEIHQYYEPLKILIYNLLTNAIHFTEKGAIVVSAIKENGHITVSVKDEGIGMSPEQIQRLMAEEVVITSANVDNKKGHGLGYLIIKDLLKTMDAKLHIDSKKGEGATVSIQINL